MHSGSASNGDSQDSSSSSSSMLWVRNLKKYVGSGNGLGSEALMGMLFLCLHCIVMIWYVCLLVFTLFDDSWAVLFIFVFLLGSYMCCDSWHVCIMYYGMLFIYCIMIHGMFLSFILRYDSYNVSFIFFACNSLLK